MIVFRVDASPEIGAGHVMRCLSLANAFSTYHHVCRFVCRHMPDYMIDKLASHGHQVMILPRIESGEIDELPHAHWLGCHQAQDAAATLQAISDIEVEWVVVDHYALDQRWESTLKEHTSRIMAIDDLADRNHNCDVLLDQNLYNESFDGYSELVPAHCQLMIGPKFAILRDEFIQQRAKLRKRSGVVQRIVIYFGGFDFFNYTTLAIQALIKLFAMQNTKAIEIDVVIGRAHTQAVEIARLCDQYKFNLHTQIDNMAELFSRADLCIGAGGISTWERCCVGLPSIALCVADNQQNQLTHAALQGLVYAPQLGEDQIASLSAHIACCLENPELLMHLSSNAQKAVDGNGVRRIVNKLGLPQLTLRRAQLTDSESIYQWRNQAHVRQFSLDSESISYDAHQAWYSATMSNPNRVLLIGECRGEPAGVVRFDLSQETALISIYLVSRMQSQVSGGQLLQSAEHWLSENYSEIRFVCADVLGENLSSIGMFKSAGYTLKAQSYQKRLLHYV